MTNRNKILLITILTSFAFWIPIWLSFTQSKGIDTSAAYGTIALYSIVVVLLEYPTGVIGDTFSHKLSTMLGFLFMSIAFIVMILAAGAFQMTIGILILALGSSLVSGSDQAYFYSLTDEYKSFYPTMKNIGLVATLIGITLGTILYKFNPNLPLIMTALSFAGAFYLMATLPEEAHLTAGVKNTKNSNPFSVAKLGVKTFLQSHSLQALLIVYAIIFAFSNNLKWLYGNLLELIKLPVEYWGLLIAVFYLGRFVGIQMQRKLKGRKSTIALLVALANFVFLLGYILNPLLLPVVIFIIMVIIGAIETDLEIEIQEETPSDVRSSILSLKSLLGRFSAAVYISFAGLLAAPTSMTKLTLATFALILFAIGIQISSYIKKKEKVNL